MELSKETVDLIQNEADKTYKYYPLAVEKNAYIKGCETWAIWKEKAEGYERALSEIAEKVIEYNNKVTGNHQAGNHCRNIAIEALEQFKQ